MQHLVFYDGTCGFCDRCVQFVLERDSGRKFAFAPLEGSTAQEFLKEHFSADTVVLVENFRSSPKTLLRSQAAFRILWHLGGWYTPLGLLSFLPGFFFDWGYNLVARNRRLLSKECVLPRPESERFLP